MCKKDPSTSVGMTLRKWRFPNISFIRDVGYPFPPTVISSAARNLPCTLLFLAPFAKGFPFSAVSHTALYRLQERSLDFARDDDTGIALSKHIRCTLRKINPFPPIPSFRAQQEIFLALHFFLLPFAKGFPFSALSCSLRRSIPVFCYHTYGAILWCARKIPRLRSG